MGAGGTEGVAVAGAAPATETPGGADRTAADRRGGDSAAGPVDGADAGADSGAGGGSGSGADPADDSGGAGADHGTDSAAAGASDDDTHGAPRRSRRFPSFTRDTARPEGGGRAASGDAPAPARQWPLLSVLCTAGIGLLIVALNPFVEAFRIGTILIGVALVGGAVLRCTVSSVGMLAVRSRFTDLVTYGLLGVLIVLLALVAQPKPWLDLPFLEHAVRFTVR
ncbi:DUF3017 domain-containing protein [Streptomyces sp. LN785]|uniref:DUF3017 domain-containing protein n=1 Tax=Streptomyces sp. LN785 TaxID=3112983 RepID=UPI003714A8BB